MRLSGKLLLVCFAVLMSACADLPRQGPSAREILEPDSSNSHSSDVSEYDVISVNEQVLETMTVQPEASLKAAFGGSARKSSTRIGVGDTVALTIWEAGPGGLFASSTTNGTNGGKTVIPGQVIQTDGSLTVPFAGRVRAAGNTPAQLEKLIVESLTGRAINPQVVATVSNRVSGSVNLVGESVGVSKLPISPAGDRLLDIIARAGLNSASIERTQIRLTRGSRSSAIPFAKLLREPSENVYVNPGDNIFVTQDPFELTIFGAAGDNSALKFGPERYSLAQALANAGGLRDNQADPSGVFVFRMKIYDRRLGKNRFSIRPTIYHLDMSKGVSIFQANRFLMQDNDVIYVATARANALQKFISILSGVRNEISAARSL